MSAPRKRLRLLKVVVHPIFALDDGETLTEYPGSQPVTIDARDWEGYPAALEAQRQEAEEALNGPEPEADEPAPA